MKRLLVVAAGMCVLGINLAGFAYAGNEVEGSMVFRQVSWVNPDGSHGIVMEDADAKSREVGDRNWVNPDGSRGTAGALDRGPSLAESPVWMNPDGVGGMLGAAIDSGDPRRSSSLAVRH